MNSESIGGDLSIPRAMRGLEMGRWRNTKPYAQELGCFLLAVKQMRR